VKDQSTERGISLPPQIYEAMKQRYSFHPHEVKVLALMAQGTTSDKAIAQALSIKTGTANNYVATIRDKLSDYFDGERWTRVQIAEWAKKELPNQKSLTS
jgi:DNA-binding CsgD family transcriptional regulator